MFQFYFSILFAIIFFAQCTEKYTPEIAQYKKLYVVNGFLTNNQRPFVQITLNQNFGDYKTLKGVGFKVEVVDKDGSIESFRDSMAGYYISRNPNFRGVVGHFYKLQMVTPDGDSIVSDFEELLPAVPIDSFTYKYKFNGIDKAYRPLEEIVFNVTTHNANKTNQYFYYSMDETYKIRSETSLDEVKQICYRSGKLEGLYVINSADYLNNNIVETPTFSISNRETKLTDRYYAKIYQYSINTSVYNYIRKLKQQNTQQGSLFDPPVDPIVGNLKNLKQPQIPVLGCFIVAGAASKHLFISRNEIGFTYFYSKAKDCDPISVTSNNDKEIERIEGMGYVKGAEYTVNGVKQYLYAREQNCFDCSVDVGSSTLKPDYWED